MLSSSTVVEEEANINIEDFRSSIPASQIKALLLKKRNLISFYTYVQGLLDFYGILKVFSLYVKEF